MDSSKDANEAAKIAMRLMAEHSKVGLPALKGATDYAEKGVDAGLPAYVQRGFQGAETAALEQSLGEASAGRTAALRGAGGRVNASSIGSFQGAAQALAKEKAGIAVSKAAAGVTQRNQLLNVLQGSGAQNTSLSTSFGGLTNRGLAAGLGGGNPAYEATVGGLSALTPILLQLLQPKGPQSNLAYRYSGATDVAANLSRVPVFG